MSAEFDLQSGFDISPLTSATQTQIMQALNQQTPLSNKGLVIYGTATPDIANNPRYSRYIWADSNFTPPILKTYNTSTLAWDSATVANDSVTNSKILDLTIQLGKMSPLGGSALQVPRINAGATAWEYWTVLIQNAQIADEAVTNNKISDDAVSTAKIEALAVTGSRLADDAVTNAKVSDNSINLGTKALDLSLTAGKIAVTVGAKLVQQVYAIIKGTDASGTDSTATTIPIDTTMPTTAQGKLFAPLSAISIDVKNATSLLLIEVQLQVSVDAALNVVAALYEAASSTAIAANSLRIDAANATGVLVLRHIYSPGATGSKTFSVYFGPAVAGTAYVNMNGAVATFYMSSSITIQEIRP